MLNKSTIEKSNLSSDERLIKDYHETNNPTLRLYAEDIKPSATQSVQHFIVNYRLKNELCPINYEGSSDVVNWLKENREKLFTCSDKEFYKEIVSELSFDVSDSTIVSYFIQPLILLRIAYKNHAVDENELKTLLDIFGSMLSKPKMNDYASKASDMFDKALYDADDIIAREDKLYNELLTKLLLEKKISSQDAKQIVEEYSNN